MKKIFFTLLIGLCALQVQSQKYTISGTIKDASNGEDLIGATMAVKELPGTGVSSNIYGFYSLSLPPGDYTFIYQYIGFRNFEKQVKLDQNVKLNIELQMESTELQEVVIIAEKEDANITDLQMSVDQIDMKEIENIPVLFGERDILKTIQLLPGVKGAGEGNSGFFVRGGSADQNLILLDEASVYNASHLLGFFSVFNSDALKDVKLYKGAMPAEFGGRLSSVLDIKMKEGNSKKMEISGGLGLIASKLTIEGPIEKNRSSFIISGRRTYADLFLKLSSDPEQRESRLYFYDLNAKANYRISEKDRLFLSGYFGRDDFGFGDDFGFDWGNVTGTLRWNHLFSDKLFVNTSFIYSDYDYVIAFGGDEGAEIGSVIQDVTLKQDYDFYWNENNKIKFGGNLIYHTFKPGEVEVLNEDDFTDNDVEIRYSLEGALYLSNQQKINDHLSLNYGLRFSNFTQYGPGDIFTYDQEGHLIDTTSYARKESVVSYYGLAPRFSANYILNPISSIKASYARNYQYLHLLSNSTSSSPTDVWMPSSNNIAPQISDQLAIGYFRNLSNNTYEFSTEVYYKKMQDVIDYRNGAEITLNPTAEGDLLYGEGRAYGLEFLLKKRKGKFTGWISYTLAKSEKQFEELNDGNWFSAKQDRTHDVSLVGMYKLNDRIDLSATWVYYTGNAVTFPIGKYEIGGQIINLYGDRNTNRMPDYHRLDLALNLKRKEYKMKKNPTGGESVKTKRKAEGSWSFSIYNVYARENAYSISFEQSEDDANETQAVQLSLFKIIPSVSYNFKF